MLNVYTVFCWCLIEYHVSICFAVFHSLLCRNSSITFIRKIEFISKNQKRWWFWRIILASIYEVVSPIIKTFKTLLWCYIVDHAATVSSSVKCTTERLKSFLSSSIPYLQHNYIIFYYHFSICKIRTYCWLEVIWKCSFLKEMNKRRLANSWISNDN